MVWKIPLDILFSSASLALGYALTYKAVKKRLVRAILGEGKEWQ